MLAYVIDTRDCMSCRVSWQSRSGGNKRELPIDKYVRETDWNMPLLVICSSLRCWKCFMNPSCLNVTTYAHIMKILMDLM